MAFSFILDTRGRPRTDPVTEAGDDASYVRFGENKD